jgi:hypothetical protein
VLDYSAWLFVAEGSDFSLPAVARQLASLAPRCPDRIDLAVSGEVRAFADWCLKVSWQEDAESWAEAERVVGGAPNPDVADIVWRPHRLARAWSEDSDPEDQHLEDYLRCVNLLVKHSWYPVQASTMLTVRWKCSAEQIAVVDQSRE